MAPAEIEHCLVEHPDVVECAVVGAQDNGLTLARAFVVVRGAVEEEALRDFVRERLSPHKVPREVRIVDDLPRTPSGQARPKGAAMRTVVVTGGAKGIGKAIAERFADDRVEAGGRDMLDVTDEDAVAAFFERVGPVDVLVNNAGVAEGAPMARTSLESWRHHFEVNATGAFLCTRAVLPGMIERGDGRIVTVASTAGLRGARYTAAYTAAKHAAVGLMRATAAEVAGTGVTANAVCPGWVRTAMMERAVERITATTDRDEEQAEAALVAQMPLGRALEPEEVADAVWFLASPQAAAINGQALEIA